MSRVKLGGRWGPGEDESFASSLRKPWYSQSLERGLGILECFSLEEQVFGVSELAERLGMSRSTTHRYVITLAELGFLVQVPGRKYRVTLRVTRLGLSAMSATSLREHAEPYLRELCSRTGFGVGLGVLDGPDVLLVAWLGGMRRGQRQAERSLAIGARLPAYCTAFGKLLLADLPLQVRRESLGGLALARRTSSTIVARRALDRELEGVREAGFAVDDEEYAPGVLAIAVRVRDGRDETVAALSMLTSSATIGLEDLASALVPHLVAAADGVSARLGFRRADELVDGLGG